MAYQVPPRHQPPINVLIVGKSGHGKSSTGNSILGSKKFVALGGPGSVTQEYQSGTTTFDDREITVADIPGLCDTSGTTQESKVEIVIKAIDTSLSVFPTGFNAILLVMSYTARLTEEEKEVIATLKSILGDDVIRCHVICVFTHGDSFKDNNDIDDDEDPALTSARFKAWFGIQDEYRDLFEECDGRFILFDNMTNIKQEKDYQIAELITVIDNMKNRQGRYTRRAFRIAEQTREQFKFELRLPLMKLDYSNQMDEIRKFIPLAPEAEDEIDHFVTLRIRVRNMKDNIMPGCQHPIASRLRGDLDNLLRLIDMEETMLSMQQMKLEETRKMEEEIRKERERMDRERQEREEREEADREELRQLEERAAEAEYNARDNDGGGGGGGGDGDEGSCVIL